MYKYKLILPLIFLTFSYTNAQVTTTSSSTSICTALNSLDLYSTDNLKILQSYLRRYFPRIVVSGVNDTQTRNYIIQFQNSFGLAKTGIMNPETVRYLINQNKCFNFESTVVRIQNATVTPSAYIAKTKQDIISDLLKNYVYPNLNIYQIFPSNTPSVSVEVSSTTQAQLNWQKNNPQ